MSNFVPPSPSPIQGIHHITGLVGSAQNDLDFYREVLGLRLIKKTVNQENPAAGWHFFFGDRDGHAGTIMTNIILEGIPLPRCVDGRGSISDVSYSVSPTSFDYWRQRLANAGHQCEDRPARFGDPVLHFRDDDGISSELIGCDDERVPNLDGDVPAENQIRGFHHATCVSRIPELTLGFLTGVLKFEVVAQADKRTRLAVGKNAPGHFIDLIEQQDGPWAQMGLGALHHIAFTVETDDFHQWAGRLGGAGLIVTETRDRGWFQSMYFTEPGGINLELSDMQPGWTFDEDMDSLGTIISLPNHLEPMREKIEAGLPEIKF